MTSNFSKCVIKEIDSFIADEKGFDVFDLPVDGCEVEGSVTPIFTTFLRPNGIFLLKIKPKVGRNTYINLFTGDGGIFVKRSDETEDSKTLMFETEEGWTEF